MNINGKNYLLLERRGCEYFKEDKGRDNIGNYRVGSYDYSIKGKNGIDYIVEFSSRDAYKWRDTNKRTGAKLKKPVRELIMKNAAALSTEYETKTEWSAFPVCYRDSKLEKDFYSAAPVPYCAETILDYINGISAEKYDGILWVYTFEAYRNAGENWTPAGLLADWAKRNRLEVTRDAYGTQFVKLYSGFYKYLCYQIEEGNKEKAKVTVYLERVAE